MTIPDEYRPALERIIQRTYDHHGKEGGAWGYDSRKDDCSYTAGCAIGISLEPSTAWLADETQSFDSGISQVLDTSYIELKRLVMEELFGDPDADPPLDVVRVLAQVQCAHDTCARADARVDDYGGEDDQRTRYRGWLTNVARAYGLTLVE